MLGQYISIVVTLLLVIVNTVIVISTRFNDLKHLDMKVNSIDNKMDKLLDRMGKVEKSQYSMKAICNERHKNE